MKKDDKNTSKIMNALKKMAYFMINQGITVGSGMLLAVHAILLLLMMHYKIPQLTILNVFSCILYFMGVIACINKFMYLSYIVVMVEIPICTVVSTHYLGWNSGFSQYLLALIPAGAYCCDMMFKGLKKSIMIFYTALILYIYIKLYIYVSSVKPLHPLRPAPINTLFLVNAMISGISIFTFSFIYLLILNANKEMLISKNNELKQETSTDPLTGLLNRRGFMPTMNNAIKNKEKFCIAFCDIDNFKRINDSYGHDAGDEILRHVTGIIKKEATGCTICRWGGEEVIVFMRAHSMPAAVRKMEHIRKTISKTPATFYGKKIYVTITIGVEEYKNTYKSVNDVIQEADKRMYYGKQNGKNRVIYELP